MRLRLEREHDLCCLRVWLGMLQESLGQWEFIQEPPAVSVSGLGESLGFSSLLQFPVLTSDLFVPGALFQAVWGLVTSAANTPPTEVHLAAHWPHGGRKRVPLMAHPFPGNL